MCTAARLGAAVLAVVFVDVVVPSAVVGVPVVGGRLALVPAFCFPLLLQADANTAATARRTTVRERRMNGQAIERARLRCAS
jgi:hypothetical protein